MAGEIKRLLDRIVEARSQGNEIVACTTKAKIALKGVSLEYDSDSPDDPLVIAKLRSIAKDMGVNL